jgi:prephenate dehydratase/chorismate mutase/prephenate dehydratase
MGLHDIRSKIDRIDLEIVTLLNRRFEYALRTKNLKTAVQDPDREQQVLGVDRFRAGALVRPDFSQRLFRVILDASKALQQENPRLIGFQGEHGAYSEVAAQRIQPAWIPIPCTSFAEVFEAVASGQFEYGVVPIENSIEGAVTQVNDLLVETDVCVAGEIEVPVHHCLLALPDTALQDIREVYSHPQALGQCRAFLTRHRFEAHPHYDTSGAAMMLAKKRLRAAGAIAARPCAELYGLRILQERIEDHPSNSTRFVLLSKRNDEQYGTKCSIMFSTEHKAGALLSVLALFSEAGINLTRIDSRPIRKDPGRFAFLLDFEASRSEPRVRAVLDHVEQQAVLFKFLGCYRDLRGHGESDAGPPSASS